MRPRRLEIQGYTGFRELQKVDFTPLELFVVTGPTGAGKTSILDAMILALYGEVPRMGKHGLADLVTHGQAEARILFEFSVDGETYRIARRLPRRGAQSATLERFDGSDWVSLVHAGGVRAANSRVIELVRLDCESFCKAVVLPQGEFSRFLKGERRERRATLVALLGLGHYERMGALARGRANELRVRGDQVRKILEEQFADATPELLADARTRAGAAADRARAFDEAVARARALDRDREAGERMAIRLAGLSEELDGLQRELRAEVEPCREAETAQAAAARRQREVLGVSERAAEQLALKQRSLEELVERVGNRERLALVQQAAAGRAEREQRAESARTALDQATEAEAEAARQVDGRQERARVLEAEAATARENAQAAAGGVEAAKGQRDALTHRLEAAERETKAASEAKRTLAQAKDQARQLAAVAEQATEEALAAEAALEDMRRDHAVAGLVSGLSAGDPCPVCDRPLAEHPTVSMDVEDRLSTARSRCGEARTAADAASRAAAGAQAEIQGAERMLGQARKRVAEALGEHSDLASLIAAAAGAVEAAEAARHECDALRTASDQADKQAGAAREQLASARTAAEAAGRERELRTDALQQVERDRDQAVNLVRDYFGGDTPEDAVGRLQAAYDEVEKAEGEVVDARSWAVTATDQLSTADQQLRDANERIGRLEVRLGELRTRAQAAAVATGKALADAADERLVADLPERAAERDAFAEALAAWCERTLGTLHEAATTVRSAIMAAADALVALAGEHDIGAADAPAALKGLIGAERDASEARVRVQEAAEGLAKRVDHRRDLEEGIAEDAKRIAVLEVLATELRADRFVDFVVAETLTLLATSASDELNRISDGRYSLVAEGGEFDVVDHVNADERRSVKTLSGGETFMASLALALALSKHVSELAGEGLGARLEAVFIDEGFGSLDPETLEEVIDSLERLRDEELLVGVISHVPTLADRIRSGLEVHKDGGRSTITESVG